MSHLHYTYRVSWSPEDDEYVGTVVELPSLSWLDPDESKAFLGIRQLTADVVTDLEARGEPVPPAIADRRYSGNFQVRLTPDRHRQLALEAAERGVSMNRLISDRLAQ